MTGRNIARYMRLNQTTEQIKEMVDTGTMAMVTAVELSYLSEEEQKQVCKIMDEHGGKIKNAQAVELHNAAGSLTEDKVKNFLMGEAKEKPVSDTKLFADMGYSTMFANGSEQDLKVLGNMKGIYKLDGYDGFGGHRERAMECLCDNVEFTEALEKIEQGIIILIYAVGGSTGSGLSAVVAQYIKDVYGDDKIIVTVPVLP